MTYTAKHVWIVATGAVALSLAVPTSPTHAFTLGGGAGTGSNPMTGAGTGNNGGGGGYGNCYNEVIYYEDSSGQYEVGLTIRSELPYGVTFTGITGYYNEWSGCRQDSSGPCCYPDNRPAYCPMSPNAVIADQVSPDDLSSYEQQAIGISQTGVMREDISQPYGGVTIPCPYAGTHEVSSHF